jgi:hypothetical protein
MSYINHLEEIIFENGEKLAESRIEEIAVFLENNADELARRIYHEKGLEICFYQSSRIVDGESLHNGVLIIE